MARKTDSKYTNATIITAAVPPSTRSKSARDPTGTRMESCLSEVLGGDRDITRFVGDHKDASSAVSHVNHLPCHNELDLACLQSRTTFQWAAAARTDDVAQSRRHRTANAWE